MAINSNLLLQIMALSEEDKYELTQALIHSGTTPKVEQPTPIVETSPKRIDETLKAYTDTVVYTRVSYDGKGVEFYVLNANGKEDTAFPFMNGVIELIQSEDNTLDIKWDKSLTRVETYRIDGKNFKYGDHKHGAHLVLKNKKPMTKAQVTEWVANHSEFILTAESKNEYHEKKDAEKKVKTEKKINDCIVYLKKHGITTV